MSSTRNLQGTPVSPGLAIGPVHVVRAAPDRIPVWSVASDRVPAEIGRLVTAMQSASEELERRREIVAREAGAQDAEIFAVHRMILQDPGALKQVEAAIREERVNAESAVQQLIKRFESTMSGLDGGQLRGLAADVSDPWRGVLEALMARDQESVRSGTDPVVLAASDLTPQVATALDPARILAVITETGGRFSHGAVLARSFGFPCVVGLPNLLARLEQGMILTVDGGEGVVKLGPDQEDIDVFLERRDRLKARQDTLARDAGEPAVTPDGARIEVRVNIQSLRDLDMFDVSHTDGVGLLRTEFLYMERKEFPSEEEQYRLYRRILERMDGRPVVIRTLDIGGDKQLPYFKTPHETNPALGWRGMRVTLEWPDLLRVQFRALLRASVHGSLRIMLPMVTALEEILQSRELFCTIRNDLQGQGYDVRPDVPVGIMCEVPSSLLALHHFIEHVDFVSVGTNDLVQYLLAVDRDNSWVARLYDPQHPAVMLALRQVADVARGAGKPCSVCGDLAGDPASAIILLGMGYDHVSVAPHFVPDVKYAVRNMNSETARGFAAEALQKVDSDGVRELLDRIRGQLYDSPTADSDLVV